MIKIYLTPAGIEGENVMQTRIALLSLIRGGARKVICDFSHTEVISRSGVDEFANVGKMIQKTGGELGICWARPHLRAMFEHAELLQSVKFYNLEESITISAMYELVRHFDRYEDIRDISTRREGDMTIIEIYLLFDSRSTMGEVQQSITVIKLDIEKKIQNSRVLIIANAYSETQQEIDVMTPTGVSDGDKEG